MIIQELQLRNYPYKERKGLAERLAKQYFIKKGYEVFRGHAVLGKEYSEYYGIYGNVRNKYDRLEHILVKKMGLLLYLMRDDLKRTNGIPDFFLKREKEHLFAEIKLEQEQIKKHQLQCMRLLEQYGFSVAVFRLKKNLYREKIEFDFEEETKHILIKQEKLKLRYK